MPRKKDKTQTVDADTGARSPSKQDILDFIKTSTAAVGKREVARAFDIKGSDRIELKRILKELAADGLIGDTKRALRPESVPSTAVVMVTNLDRDGDLIGKPLHWNADEDGVAPKIRFEITRRYEGPSIGVGDHVLARLRATSGETDGAAFIASPVKRLPRDKPRQLGLLAKTGQGFAVQSIDKKDQKELTIIGGDLDGAVDGELVRFEVVRDAKIGRASARIIERVGHPKAEKAVSLIAIHNHGLRDVFPDEVLAELDHLPRFTASHREDLTRVPLITIDPFDAKDHDDAVWAAPDADPQNEGGVIVIVAIADVAYYVRPGSALDQEARLRGNSVYFPDRVVPMLPEKLSNGLCSLLENEPRPCLAVRMTFDASGKKMKHHFMRATMRSAAKLSYQAAQAAIDGNPDQKTAPLLDTVLRPLWHAYEVLKKGRDKRAPLDLDLPERKIVLDKNGLVADVIVPERLEAHKLIEEFMIQANVAAAEALETQKCPLIYRVHDAPSTEKTTALSEFLATLGISAPKTGFNRPSQFNRILERGRGKDYQDLLNEVVLRSQAQAEYSTQNLGHFGLNLRRYAHFTSPIRRYADLIVHRALVTAFKFGEGGFRDTDKDKLDAVAESISQSERKAMSAERETLDRLIAMHLAERVGSDFKGRISGVTRFGLFVKLSETGADGFVPIATLGNEYFKHLENAHALVGERSGESYRLGDVIDVRLAEANPAAGALRFEVVSDGKKRSELKAGSGSRTKLGRRPGNLGRVGQRGKRPSKLRK